MNENHFYQNTPQEYHTGLNTPPRQGGLLAFALGATIFLCGLVSLLSLANVSLLELSGQQGNSNISLSDSSDPAAVCLDLRTNSPIQGQSLSQRCRSYYNLPQGLYLTRVDEDSIFYSRGLRSGDILLSFNGTKVTEPESLMSMVFRASQGQTLELQFYRLGKVYTVTVSLE